MADGTRLVIADEPRAFADAVVRVLRDVPRRRSIEAAARRLVVEHYDWAAVGGVLEQALIRFARPGTARARGVAAALDATAPSTRAEQRARSGQAVGASESYGVR